MTAPRAWKVTVFSALAAASIALSPQVGAQTGSQPGAQNGMQTGALPQGRATTKTPERKARPAASVRRQPQEEAALPRQGAAAKAAATERKAKPAAGAQKKKLARPAPPVGSGARKKAKAASRSPSERLNAWTVGLAGGIYEGSPIRLASEMARVADAGENLHILPIITRGTTENLNSLLYLKGVDAAIVNSDALEEYKIQMPKIQKNIRYILNLFPSEMHVLVRPEINSWQDLIGKKVSFNTWGTAASYSGPLVFSRLGVSVEKTFMPHQIALEALKRGDLAGIVVVSSKPADPFLRQKFEPGFKFLPVPYNSKLEDYYLPAVLDASEYPTLITEGEQVATIAVPTALIAYNWPEGSNRAERVARFTNQLFDRMGTLQGGGFDQKWNSINLAAPVHGVNTRLPAAQDWLDRHNGKANAQFRDEDEGEYARPRPLRHR